MKTIVNFINEINNEIYETKNSKLINTQSDVEELEITELQMHKILFFVYGEFYKKYKKELWKPNFKAWKYGPVELNFRNDENLSNTIDIDKLDKNEINYLKELITRLLKTSIWSLVDFSHTFDCWMNKYNSDDQSMNNNEINEEFKKIFI